MPAPRYAVTNTVALYTLYFPSLRIPASAAVTTMRPGSAQYAMPSVVRDMWRVNPKPIPADRLGDDAVPDNTGRIVVEADGGIIVAVGPAVWARLAAETPLLTFLGDDPAVVAAMEAAEANRFSSGAPLPSLLSQAKSLISSVVTWVDDGAKVASAEVVAARLTACKTCPDYDPNGFGPGLMRCKRCGCGGAKLHMETATCPLTKW